MPDDWKKEQNQHPAYKVIMDMEQVVMIEKIRSQALADEGISAVLMYGSFANGEGDCYSDIEWAVTEAGKKKKKDFSKAGFMTYDEGLCVQCMHVGPYICTVGRLRQRHLCESLSP